MRCSLILLIGISITSFAKDNDNEAIELLKKAIVAHGGKNNLLKLQNYYELVTGYDQKPEGKTPFIKGEYYYHAPFCQHAITYDVEFKDGKKRNIIAVSNKDSAWVKIEDRVLELSKEQHLSPKEKCYAWHVRALYPLIEDNVYSLKYLGENKMEELPVYGIKISSKEHWDLEFYFSKQTYLLLGIKSKEINTKGKFYNVVTMLYGHKNYDGLMHPTKVIRSNDDDTTKKIDETIQFKSLNKPDENMFVRPK